MSQIASRLLCQALGFVAVLSVLPVQAQSVRDSEVYDLTVNSRTLSSIKNIYQNHRDPAQDWIGFVAAFQTFNVQVTRNGALVSLSAVPPEFKVGMKDSASSASEAFYNCYAYAANGLYGDFPFTLRVSGLMRNELFYSTRELVKKAVQDEINRRLSLPQQRHSKKEWSDEALARIRKKIQHEVRRLIPQLEKKYRSAFVLREHLRLTKQAYFCE